MCNYAQNGVQKSLREVHLGPQLVDLSLHAALAKKRKIFDSSHVAWCAVRLYTPYTFELYVREKKKKEERRREQNRNFRARFF